MTTSLPYPARRFVDEDAVFTVIETDPDTGFDRIVRVSRDDIAPMLPEYKYPPVPPRLIEERPAERVGRRPVVRHRPRTAGVAPRWEADSTT